MDLSNYFQEQKWMINLRWNSVTSLMIHDKQFLACSMLKTLINGQALPRDLEISHEDNWILNRIDFIFEDYFNETITINCIGFSTGTCVYIINLYYGFYFMLRQIFTNDWKCHFNIMIKCKVGDSCIVTMYIQKQKVMINISSENTHFINKFTKLKCW